MVSGVTFFFNIYINLLYQRNFQPGLCVMGFVEHLGYFALISPLTKPSIIASEEVKNITLQTHTHKAHPQRVTRKAHLTLNQGELRIVSQL